MMPQLRCCDSPILVGLARQLCNTVQWRSTDLGIRTGKVERSVKVVRRIIVALPWRPSDRSGR